MKFKVGDKVVCVDNNSYPQELELGNVYRVGRVVPGLYREYDGVNVDGLFTKFCANRFRLAPNELPPVGSIIEIYPPHVTKLTTLSTDSNARKNFPLFRGCLRYFPAAIAGAANISKLGNDKHNPGEELHHARGKSTDHGDCILRHLLDVEDLMAARERGDTSITPEAILLEASQMVWRALAFSQELHEKFGAPLAPGAKQSGKS